MPSHLWRQIQKANPDLPEQDVTAIEKRSLHQMFVLIHQHKLHPNEAREIMMDDLAPMLVPDQKHGSTLSSGVDASDVNDMLGLIETYVDDGLVTFERVWLKLRDEFELAGEMSRHFEAAWKLMCGETLSVADVTAEKNNTDYAVPSVASNPKGEPGPAGIGRDSNREEVDAAAAPSPPRSAEAPKARTTPEQREALMRSFQETFRKTIAGERSRSRRSARSSPR